jgi:hypothetical protein
MMQAEISPEDPSSPTLVQAIKLLRAARQGVKDIMKEAKKHREEFLKDRAADHRLAGRIPAAKIVDMIQKMEYNTRCFAHLRRIRGKNKSSGLQFIMIPDPDDPETDPSKKRWIGVFDLEEVNERLEVRNKGHFSQSEGTPFTVDPLK